MKSFRFGKKLYKNIKKKANTQQKEIVLSNDKNSSTVNCESL